MLEIQHRQIMVVNEFCIELQCKVITDKLRYQVYAAKNKIM